MLKKASCLNTSITYLQKNLKYRKPLSQQISFGRTDTTRTKNEATNHVSLELSFSFCCWYQRDSYSHFRWSRNNWKKNIRLQIAKILINFMESYIKSSGRKLHLKSISIIKSFNKMVMKQNTLRHCSVFANLNKKIRYPKIKTTHYLKRERINWHSMRQYAIYFSRISLNRKCSRLA